MNPRNVSIVVPVFNEEDAIGSFANELTTSFPEADIILIDDGSTDKTAEVLKSIPLKVISHSINRGYGASLKTGILNAKRDYVLFCDGDGQHSVEDINKIIESMDDFDMVVGARDGDSHRPWSRRPGIFILRVFANYLAGQKIPDLNSGLRMFRKEGLLKYIHLMPNGFSFSTTSTFAMVKTNKNVKYIPITVRKRIGTSSVRQWRHGPQTLMLMLRLTVLFEPLKVFLTVAGFTFLIGICSFAIDIFSPPWGISDTTMLLFNSSLIIFMFGLLCDQVSAIRREEKE